MVNIRFFPLDITYKVVNGKPLIYLFGKSLEGTQICVVDDFEPYFYVIPKQLDVKQKLVSLKLEEDQENYFVTKVEEVKKRFLEKEVNALKVFVNIPKAVPKIKDIVREWDFVSGVFEYDILFVRRYLIDKGITPMTLVEADCESLIEKSKVHCFKANKIKQFSDDTLKNPKVLAVDIETYNPIGKMMIPEEHPILMVALYGENFKKVITWKQFPTNEKYIEFVKSEADLIDRLKEIIEDFRPDIISGYFSDGFDFPYIKTRAKKYRIKLDLGLDFSELTISGRAEKTASITGIVHFDVFKFIRKVISKTMETDIFTLEAVSQEILGDKKHDIDVEGLAKAWDDTNIKLEEYCKYNLHDSKLAYDLCQKVFPNIIELIKIIGLPLFDINRMSFSQFVEWYIIKQAKNFNQINPNKPSYREQERRMNYRLKGGFVFEPKPGFYHNIVVFDYRSLYPTIIASHNISIDTLNCTCCEGDKVPTDRGDFWFCKNKKGFLSSIIEDLITRRARIKEMLKKDNKDNLLVARSQALKDLANAFYGYLGFAPARWYSVECAESTTGYARHYVKDVIEKAKKEGFSVLYGDTDSCFVLLEQKTKQDAVKFVEKINLELPGLMELEYENFYPSGIFVSIKIAESGAKKKYALIDEKGIIKIRGFETVRRNWSFIAKDVQKNVLDLILRENNPEKALEHVKKTIDDLRDNNIPLKKLVIFTQLRKNIENYESFGPHVAAAQRMKNKGISVGPGTMIKFVVTKGKGKIRDRVKLEDETTQKEYDGEYYINNQIIPSLEKIFEALGIDLNQSITKEGQSTLSGFG